MGQVFRICRIKAAGNDHGLFSPTVQDAVLDMCGRGRDLFHWIACSNGDTISKSDSFRILDDPAVSTGTKYHAAEQNRKKLSHEYFPSRTT